MAVSPFLAGLISGGASSANQYLVNKRKQEADLAEEQRKYKQQLDLINARNDIKKQQVKTQQDAFKKLQLLLHPEQNVPQSNVPQSNLAPTGIEGLLGASPYTDSNDYVPQDTPYDVNTGEIADENSPDYPQNNDRYLISPQDNINNVVPEEKPKEQPKPGEEFQKLLQGRTAAREQAYNIIMQGGFDDGDMTKLAKMIDEKLPLPKFRYNDRSSKTIYAEWDGKLYDTGHPNPIYYSTPDNFKYETRVIEENGTKKPMIIKYDKETMQPISMVEDKYYQPKNVAVYQTHIGGKEYKVYKKDTGAEEKFYLGESKGKADGESKTTTLDLDIKSSKSAAKLKSFFEGSFKTYYDLKPNEVSSILNRASGSNPVSSSDEHKIAGFIDNYNNAVNTIELDMEMAGGEIADLKREFYNQVLIPRIKQKYPKFDNYTEDSKAKAIDVYLSQVGYETVPKLFKQWIDQAQEDYDKSGEYAPQIFKNMKQLFTAWVDMKFGRTKETAVKAARYYK